MNSVPEGCYAAALTPLQSDLSCDCDELVSHCLDLLKRGCQGVVLFGTTGEGPSFSVDERIEVLKTVIEKGLDPAKIIFGNGSSGIIDTVRLSLASIKLGCPSLLIAPPCFYKNVPEEGVIAYYRTIIQKIDDPELRILLYHIPQMTGVPITVNIVRVLAKEFPTTVIGLKESEGNPGFMKQLLKEFPKLNIFAGNEKQIVEATRLGAAGTICGIANVFPELIASLVHQGKGRGLSDSSSQIDMIFSALNDYSFIPAFKSLMETRRGESWGRVRPPLVVLKSEEKSDFLSRCCIE